MRQQSRKHWSRVGQTRVFGHPKMPGYCFGSDQADQPAQGAVARMGGRITTCPARVSQGDLLVLFPALVFVLAPVEDSICIGYRGDCT